MHGLESHLKRQIPGDGDSRGRKEGEEEISRVPPGRDSGAFAKLENAGEE